MFEAPIVMFLDEILTCKMHNYFFKYKSFINIVEKDVIEANKLTTSNMLLNFDDNFDTEYIRNK